MDTRNLHQSPEEIIKTATPAQKIIWNMIFLLTGDRATLSQLYYQGALTGTEFNTYRARRIFLAYELTLFTGALSVNPNAGTFYDEGNNIDFVTQNNIVYWDATAAAARYVGNDIFLKNIYFSRFTGLGYSALSFKGYRIIY